jgi:hypothetical protein
MDIRLPASAGETQTYTMVADPVTPEAPPAPAPRRFIAAAHVVADPFAANDPSTSTSIDWEATLRFRRHLDGLGLSIAEAMDTAQRGMGLLWPQAFDLVKNTLREIDGGRVYSGCGTDDMRLERPRDLDKVVRQYLAQASELQKVGSRIILMCSRDLCRVARTSQDYVSVYDRVLAECDEPVVLHWLGPMFDNELAGYWGSDDFEAAAATVLEIIERVPGKVDGIKVSLLDKDKEISLRRRLPHGVLMYTGDDFNYPELIGGDDTHVSHALLGIFDPIAPLLPAALNRLAGNDREGFAETLAPTLPLARHVFQHPTKFYKSGVVFLAWLNGFQDHFVMVQGAQSMRPLPYYVECFRLADQAGLLRDPGLARSRMQDFLKLYGVA